MQNSSMYCIVISTLVRELHHSSMLSFSTQSHALLADCDLGGDKWTFVTTLKNFPLECLKIPR